ncbi:HNH endonuclease [Deinococcus arcticus]|uniref:HNH endonuclease n=1 Tax=Deinococcus arcticus TaxID=2136176 RepID=UPI001304BB6A|nr:HNH endonuclease signature motif containing protein [Deinococcus arcticus]
MILDYINENISEAQKILDTNSAIPNDLLRKYNYAPLKELIIREVSGKCVYCETKIMGNQFGDLDHVIPKAKFIASHDASGIFSHRNLTICCSVCNNKKSNLGTTISLLSPYTNKPEHHIYYVGSQIYYSTPEGKKLILALELDIRDDLIVNINKKLKELHNLIYQFDTERDPEVKALIKKRLLRESKKEMEYSLATFHFLKIHKLI